MQSLRQLLNINEEEHSISGLTDELKAQYVCNYFDNHDESIVFVTNTLFEANKFYQAISNYTDNVHFFPMDDFLTSEALAVSPELKITRLTTLNHLIDSKKSIVVANLMGLLRYLPPVKVYRKHVISLKKDEMYDPKILVEELFRAGYIRETVVNKTGEISVRGFVIDIYPLGHDDPVRIEFWGDQIDSIKKFDVNTQRTKDELESVWIYPNTERLALSDTVLFNEPHRAIKKYDTVSSVLDYSNQSCLIINDMGQLETSYHLLVDEMFEYSISVDLPGDTKYMHELPSLIHGNVKYLSRLDDSLTNTGLVINSNEITSFPKEKNIINQYLNKQLTRKNVYLIVSNRYRANNVIAWLENPNIVFTDFQDIKVKKINLIIGTIQSGYETESMVVISEKELFQKENKKISYKNNLKLGTRIRDVSKLMTGDYIVHYTHGIGRYLGLKTLAKNGIKKDYLTVEYKNHDKLYIPVEKIELITKYASSDGAAPKLSKLGGTDWEKTKQRVREKAKDMAEELLALYAAREASVGFAFLKDSEEQIAFESEFVYEPTFDQIKVIEEIKKDMESITPMDRLLCGDVGYGKTEVAFRAMFKAVLSGKQVAFLCPTTILSNQHYQNAIDRFQNYAVNIALLNRFVSQKKMKESLQQIKEGKADIIIGTHRLLSDDIIFHDLGLLVVDEEQRFGVKHKEKMKQLRHNLDVLTLSATPIPRTLQMSMSGLRSFSLIETPPNNRYPIQTYVLAQNDQIIKDAIYKELSRHGQIFLLCNKIADMRKYQDYIQKLVPEARIIVAHGQMNKTQLEDVMYDFTNQEYDVLVCTTIIETGIDIPTVNTLIILDADHFGLAQLYQIRGRVGRSNQIAYCYLMYHKQKILSEIALKRLKVIKEFTELGSGFSIAMRDLSIRGAGDILGSEQAGFVDSVGVEVFLKMLEEEIDQKRGKGVVIKNNVSDTQSLIEVDTSIDTAYVEEEELRIEIHRLINQIDAYEKIEETKKVLEDRFGSLSLNNIIYMYQQWFEHEANQLGITKVRQTKNFIEVIIPTELTNRLNPQALFIDSISISRMFRFGMRGKQLLIILDTIKLERHFLYYLIDLLKLIKDQVNSSV